jgi:CheY-like chemotaxis protein
LFDEILEIHKIESGGLPVSVSEIDISSVLKSAQEKVMELLKSEKNSRLIVETFTGHPEKVKGFFSDESRIILIFELISTILIQARKSGKVSIGYKENVRKGDHSFFIRYKQDIPMSAFQPISTPAHFIFEKLDVIGEIHYRLTKLTIELLGGIYSLHNGYDYQEFAFSIPSLKKSNKKGLFNTRQFTFKGQNVLIMSAVADIKKLFTEISADADIKFDFVTDGLNALNVVRKKQYDAILLDITDDNPDGLETVWALRHKGNKTPMLAIVEQENQEIKEKCIKMGCHNFLGKPLNNQIIIHKLHRILNPEK